MKLMMRRILIDYVEEVLIAEQRWDC
ncbi:hypothetical protein ACHAXS_000170 [Conticribra weissflogii]